MTGSCTEDYSTSRARRARPTMSAYDNASGSTRAPQELMSPLSSEAVVQRSERWDVAGSALGAHLVRKIRWYPESERTISDILPTAVALERDRRLSE